MLHKCDNPWCIRPDHLFLGTVGENNADRANKGRDAKTHAYGAKKTIRRFTDDQVRCIRESTKTYRQLAEEYSCDPKTLLNIRKVRKYQDVL